MAVQYSEILEFSHVIIIYLENSLHRAKLDQIDFADFSLACSDDSLAIAISIAFKVGNFIVEHYYVL